MIGMQSHKHHIKFTSRIAISISQCWYQGHQYQIPQLAIRKTGKLSIHFVTPQFEVSQRTQFLIKKFQLGLTPLVAEYHGPGRPPQFKWAWWWDTTINKSKSLSNLWIPQINRLPVNNNRSSCQEIEIWPNLFKASAKLWLIIEIELLKLEIEETNTPRQIV